MVHKFVNNIASEMGVNLSKVSLIEGNSLGCHDASLLKIRCNGNDLCLLIYKKDIENLNNGKIVDRLEGKLRSTLSTCL
jgi:hypothetical protein